MGLPVLLLEKGRQRFVHRIVERAAEAIEQDGAHVVVLGSTGLAEQMKAGLLRRGLEVPVIDPAGTALKLAQALVGAGLTHSRRTYPQPPEKEILGYD